MKKIKVIIFITILIISICSIIFATTTSDTRKVYVSDDSSKYHLQGCDEMHSRPKQTTVATAENYGWSPCKVCNPYGLATEFYGEQKDYTLLGWIIIIAFYMAIPIIYKLNLSRWQSKHYLRNFLIKNSVIVSLFWEIMMIYTNGFNIYQLIVLSLLGLIFYGINYIILKNNIDNIVSD